MAKIVLLVGLFAFAAVQLSQAAPKPDDATAEPVQALAETQPPVPGLRAGDDTTIHPSATAISSAELYLATMDLSLTWSINTEGPTEEGRTEEGQIEEGQIEEGQIEEGQIEEGQIEEGQIEDGQTEEGQTEKGQTKEVYNNKWWDYVPRKSFVLKTKSSEATPPTEMPGSDTKRPGASTPPTPTVQGKTEVLEVSAGTTEVVAETKA